MIVAQASFDKLRTGLACVYPDVALFVSDKLRRDGVRGSSKVRKCEYNQ